MKLHSAQRPYRQRGITFFGLIILVLFIVAAFAIGSQSVPIFLEYVAAKKAIEKAKNETTVKAVRDAFDRAAAIDDINAIKGSDLEVTKVDDKVQVSFKYSREIHLTGPAYLVYRFEATTREK